MTSFSIAALLSVVLFVVALPATLGFHVAPAARHDSRSLALFGTRREVMVGAGFTAASVLASGLPASAVDEGKVVVLQVDNLDGVAGKTGTIKIQLHPEWSPNGVKRFEVRQRQ